MGRLSKIKGVEILAQAMTKLIEQLPNVHLMFVGPDEDQILPKIRARFERSNLLDYLHIAGAIEGEARRAYWAASDVFCLPSVAEGFSVALIEALGAGLPAVITPGCHFEEVKSAGAGRIVLRNPDTLAMGLKEVLTNPERALMGRKARELVMNKYTWENIVRQYEKIINQI